MVRARARGDEGRRGTMGDDRRTTNDARRRTTRTRTAKDDEDEDEDEDGK